MDISVIIRLMVMMLGYVLVKLNVMDSIVVVMLMSVLLINKLIRLNFFWMWFYNVILFKSLM